MENETEELNTDWVVEFEKKDVLYKDYYKEDLYYTNIHFVYINESNHIEKIREEVYYMKTPNYISRDEIIGILKRNTFHNNKKYSILSILKFVISLEPEEISHFLSKHIEKEKSFLVSMKHIDAISFEPVINMFHDLTDLFFLFHEAQLYQARKNNLNVTKKIYLKNLNHKKTIRYY